MNTGAVTAMDFDALVGDILDNRRSFLPGPPCDAAAIRANLVRPVLVGGLSEVETFLVLSCLPAESEAVELQEMDKGLSGSKVYQARVRRARRLSKPFVLKIGPLPKIAREASALSELVAPTLLGIAPPVFRAWGDLGLVAQELATLSENSILESLRTRVRRTDDGPRLVHRILNDRLGVWYLAPSSAQSHSLRELLAPYLSRSPSFDDGFPPRWDELLAFVEEEAGAPWANVEPAVSAALNREVMLPMTIVHGDLHTQNVVVDDHDECWPIDFGWTRDNSSAVVDLTMLECSLKFLTLPMRADVRTLLRQEKALACLDDPPPPGLTPYRDEVERVFRTVAAVRQHAFGSLSISQDDYLAALLLMTFSLTTHPGLNTPYMLLSLQLLAERCL